MQGKIIRIFLKTLGYLSVSLVLLSFLFLLAIQSFTFQTWLGHKAGNYLTKELKAKVYIERINIEFFRSASLQSVQIEDLHHDTLFSGNLVVKLNLFSFRRHILEFEESALLDAKAKIIHYPGEKSLNYEFITDYFSFADSSTNSPSSWTIKPGNLVVKNLNFSYEDHRYPNADPNRIDYNHIHVRHLNGKLKDINFRGDSIMAVLAHLEGKEQSGFELKELSGQVSLSNHHLHVNHLRLQTDHTLIKGILRFNYKEWADYADFISKVNLDCVLEDSTRVNPEDIAFFASELGGLNRVIDLTAEVKGTVNDLRLQNLRFSFGDYSRFSGYASVSGLPDLESTFIHLDAKHLSTHYNDLSELPTYPFNKKNKLSVPEAIRKLGPISYRGKFDGFLNDFTTYGMFTTALGKIDTKLSLNLGPDKKSVNYHGSIATEQFELGTVLDMKSFGSLSFNAELEGKGLKVEDIAASFKIQCSKISYLGYSYKDIEVQGNFEDKIFNGLLICNDSNAMLDFNGSIDFTGKIPEMEFSSNIQRLDLNRVNLISPRDSGIVSTQMMISTNGHSIDDLSGQVYFDNTVYKTTGRSYKLSSLSLDLRQQEPVKHIHLISAYLDADLRGRYLLSKLPGAFSDFLYAYYPTFFPKIKFPLKHNDSLIFSMNIKNFQVIHDLFLKDYMLSKGSQLEARFVGGQNKLSLSANLPVFSYRKINFKETGIEVNDLGNQLKMRVSASALTMEDSVLFKNLELITHSKDKSLAYNFHWDDKDSVINKGTLIGSMSFNTSSFDLSCDSLQIFRKEDAWQLEAPNRISFMNSGEIYVKPIHITNHEQEIKIEGNYTTRPSDSLELAAKDLKMEVFNPLLKFVGLKFGGLLNGYMVFSNTDSTFAFRGNLDVQKFKLNDNSLGEVRLITEYNTAENNIRLNGYTSLGLGEYWGGNAKDITFSGFYYPDRKQESIDLDFIANAANLRMLNPLLEGYLSIESGFVKGSGKIHGDPSQIKIDSKLNLFQSQVKVDYTNVRYYASGEIEIMPDQIRFSDLLIRDRSMRSPVLGILNGNIFHNNFENIRIDYDINYKNMLVLNTTELDNPLYYGKVYGGGNLSIYGFLNNLNMQITHTVTNNSKFILPLDGPAEMNEEEFIHFVAKDSIKPRKENTLSGFNLDMRLYIKPEAEACIIMDRKTGDMLNVQGQGKIDLNINTLGKFDMTGDYIITDGDYQFTLKTLINKKFAIDAGSSITWSGDPMNAELNVVARYKQRASVAPLLNDTTGQYAARQPVDCKLLISGKLTTPNIKFDVDVPNLETTAMARIDNVLSDEAELNRQVFSFLLFGSFVVPQIYTSQGGGVSAGGAAAASGSEMLSNRASEFINSYFGNLTGITDMQVGVNYRPATGSNTEEFDVAVSKQFMNNRINVDGNFGMSNNPNTNSSGLIGDITVEYKLSDDGRYRVKVFNETNDNTQVTIMGGPYTQGVGLFYREEFNTFKDLIQSYKKKSKN